MTFENNPHFVAYCRCLRELHCLIVSNNDEGEEGELLRDQMDFHWYKLTDEEIECVDELSEQLYEGEENECCHANG